MGLLIKMVTLCAPASRLASVIFALLGALVPSSSTLTLSTKTQPLAIYSSASRREHMPRSDINFDTRIIGVGSGMTLDRSVRFVAPGLGAFRVGRVMGVRFYAASRSSRNT